MGEREKREERSSQMGRSEYEEKRVEQIRKNRSRLLALGVESSSSRLASSSQSSSSSSSRKKKKREENDVRKSARLQRQLQLKKEEEEEEQHLPSLDRRLQVQKVEEECFRRRKSRRMPTPTSPDSCKAMKLAPDLPEVGSKLWPEFGLGPKAYVMARLRGSRQPPKFSKYSGIQEWANAVALFINVTGKNGQLYQNIFMDNFERMTWFAQKYHVEETPVVQRLLRLTSKREGDDSSRERDPVLLFCRREGEPYIFCGRTALDHFDAESRPLKFIWKLVDNEVLRSSKEFMDIVC